DPPWTSKTRFLPAPLIVSRVAPGPMIVVVALSVSTSGPPISLIVRGPLPKTAASNLMGSGPGRLFASAIVSRQLVRPSNASTTSRGVVNFRLGGSVLALAVTAAVLVAVALALLLAVTWTLNV